MNWSLEEKRIELSFWVVRELVRNIFRQVYFIISVNHPEPRYDDVFFGGVNWLDKL